jgi:azurin
MFAKRLSQAVLWTLIVLALSSVDGLLRAQPAVKTVEIVGNDSMKYSVTTIQANPGDGIKIKLTSQGSMPKIAMSHNVVLLKKGADANAFANAAATARATNFIPPAMQNQVIAATGLAGNGETVEVTFKAPAEAGSYTFLCTFPGHAAVGMKGTLVVK